MNGDQTICDASGYLHEASEYGPSGELFQIRQLFADDPIKSLARGTPNAQTLAQVEPHIPMDAYPLEEKDVLLSRKTLATAIRMFRLINDPNAIPETTIPLVAREYMAAVVALKEWGINPAMAAAIRYPVAHFNAAVEYGVAHGASPYQARYVIKGHRATTPMDNIESFIANRDFLWGKYSDNPNVTYQTCTLLATRHLNDPTKSMEAYLAIVNLLYEEFRDESKTVGYIVRNEAARGNSAALISKHVKAWKMDFETLRADPALSHIEDTTLELVAWRFNIHDPDTLRMAIQFYQRYERGRYATPFEKVAYRLAADEGKSAEEQSLGTEADTANRELIAKIISHLELFERQALLYIYGLIELEPEETTAILSATGANTLEEYVECHLLPKVRSLPATKSLELL